MQKILIRYCPVPSGIARYDQNSLKTAVLDLFFSAWQ